ncbi:MAG: hypothetical protein ABSG25_09050 [Bryobacteraceae bacterium]
MRSAALAGIAMEIEDGFLLAHVARPLPHERASPFRWQYEATRGGSAPPRTVYAATGNATPTGGFPAPIITCGVLGTDGMRPFDSFHLFVFAPIRAYPIIF